MKLLTVPCRVLAAIAFFLLVSLRINAQIKWDFDGGTGTASPIASSIPSNITVSDFSAGNANGSTPLITNTSASGTYTGASGNYNATVSVVTGAFSASSTYFQFTITPATGYQITISALQFGTRSTGQGPNAYQVRTDVDAFATSIAANSLSSNSTWSLKQHTALNSGNGIVGALSTPIIVRIYGYSPNSPVASTPNWRLDDVAITATAVPIIGTSPSAATVCSGSTASFSIAATGNPTSYIWQSSPDGVSWTTIDASTAGTFYTNYTTSSLSVNNITAALNSYRYKAAASNEGGTSAYSSPALLTAYTSTWNGSQSSVFSYGSNWTGCPMTSSTNAIVPTGSANLPIIVTGTGSLNNLNVQSATSMNITGILEIGGTITNNGTINAGSGTITMNGSTAQVIPTSVFSNNSVQNLIINNTAGVTLNGALKITGTLTPTAGILTTNGNLTLASDAASTARVAAGSTAGGYINGNVTVQRYVAGGGLASAVPSKRAYRFIAHPFSSAIAINQLSASGGIDITGNGGASNGFTSTASNNASVFMYNTVAGNGGTNDPGWAAFSNANSSTWSRYQGIRAFVRGTQGQGLDGNNGYTVGSPTLNLTGSLNTGNQTVSLVYGGANWNLVGNPFASPVNLNLVTRTNTSNFIYVWKVDQGIRGAYSIAQDIGSTTYNLPAYGSFFVQTTGSSPSMVFHETDKTANTSADVLFRTNSNDASLKLKLESTDGSIFWDELHFNFNDKYRDANEAGNDGAKIINPDVSFYSISSNNERLSIDRRPIKDNSIIPLGLITNQARAFRLSVTDMANVQAGMQFYLKDNLLNTFTELGTGTSYDFTTTADAGTQGEQRFSIMQKIAPTLASANTKFTIKVSPNPVKDILNIQCEGLNSSQTSSINIIDASGRTVIIMDLGKTGSCNQHIPLNSYSNGTYIVQLLNGESRYSQTIIKQ